MIHQLSDAVLNDFLYSFRDAARYVSLHSTTPTFSQPELTEIAFEGYARRPINDWSTPDNGLIYNTAVIEWGGLPTGTEVRAVGLMRNATGANLMAYGFLNVPLTVTGSTMSIAARQLAVRIE